MNIGAVILIVIPGVIAAGVHMLIKGTKGERLSLKAALFAWCCYTYAVNFCIGLVKCLQGWGGMEYTEALSETSNIPKYGSLALILAVLFAALWNWKTLRPMLPKWLSAAPGDETARLRGREEALTGGDRAKFVAASVLAALFCLFYWGHVRYKTLDFNVATLIFSYRYGFVCRGLIGTLLEAAAKLFGTKLSAVFIDRFSFLSLFVFVLAVILFLYGAGRRTERLFGGALARDVLLAGLVFEAGIGFSTFFVDWGRMDLYLLILSLLACWLLVIRKWTPVVVVIAAVCILIHEGYLFTYANLLFVMLAYRAVRAWEDKPRTAIKYAVELFASAGITAGLFVYFYFFARPDPDLTYIAVLKHTLEVIETPSKYLIDAIYAIRGLLFGDRWTYMGTVVMLERRRYLIPTLLTFSPFVIVFFAYWRLVLKQAARSGLSRLRRVLYWLIPFGSAAAIPLFMLHMDYWRWYYQICFYELFVVLAMIAAGDEIMAASLRTLFDRLRSIRYLPSALAVYAVMIGPVWNEGFTLTNYIMSGLESLKRLF